MVFKFARPWASGGSSGPSAPAPLHVNVWDGYRWSEALAAPPRTLACLFIHGLGEGGYVFEPVVPRLDVPGVCLVPDLRGHGDSAWEPDGDYTIARHVADVEGLIRRLGPRPLILIGHSLGGAVALQLAARGHLDMRGLVLVDMGPELDAAMLHQMFEAARAEDRVYADPAEFRAQMAGTRPLVEAATLDLYTDRALRRRDDGGYVLKRDGRVTDRFRSEALPAGDGKADRASATMWSALGALECPLLVLRGAASAALPLAVAQRMARGAGDGTLRIVPNAGHGVMADNADGFVAALRPVLAAWS